MTGQGIASSLRVNRQIDMVTEFDHHAGLRNVRYPVLALRCLVIHLAPTHLMFWIPYRLIV